MVLRAKIPEAPSADKRGLYAWPRRYSEGIRITQTVRILSAAAPVPNPRNLFLTRFRIAQSLNCCRTTLTATSQGGVEAICGGRRFLTKEEKLEWLEEYKTNLENELKGVAERIEELKH